MAWQVCTQYTNRSQLTEHCGMSAEFMTTVQKVFWTFLVCGIMLPVRDTVHFVVVGGYKTAFWEMEIYPFSVSVNNNFAY